VTGAVLTSVELAGLIAAGGARRTRPPAGSASAIAHRYETIAGLFPAVATAIGSLVSGSRPKPEGTGSRRSPRGTPAARTGTVISVGGNLVASGDRSHPRAVFGGTSSSPA
jgi:hypothetical protein